MKKLIIFDFDGVLANTEEFCFEIHKEVNKDLTWEKWQEFCIGNFIDSMNKKDEEKTHVTPSNFYEKYQREIEKINIETVLIKLITDLVGKGNILSVVSSTNTEYIKNFLEKEGVLKYFSEILGADVHKDKSIKINSLLEKHELNSNDAVLITDTLGDIFEAEKSGVRSVGVTWGLHDRKTLEKGNPVMIIDDPRYLENAIENVLK